MIVNCAGLGPTAGVLAASGEDLDQMEQLNVVALHRLALAAAAAFCTRGTGSIINLASAVALMPDRFNATYGATKAFFLALTQGLHGEVARYGVRVQAVLPGLTPRTIMDAGDMVKAALGGFDQGELVTIPSLPEIADWHAFNAARLRLIPNLSWEKAAMRYRTAATSLS